MSTDTSSTTGTPPQRDLVFVPIPKATPEQRYHAPNNFRRPLLSVLGTTLVAGACLSLLAVPAIIILMMGANTYKTEPNLLWIWVMMFVFLEVIAVFTATNLWREALGYTSHQDYLRSTRSEPRS
jgi:hypothetical protein